MANIQKRPDGRWRARYRDVDGREHSKHFERKVDGQRWLDEVTAAVVTGQYVDPKAGRETFKTYAEKWRAIQQHRPGTARLYERVLRLHVYPVLGDRRLKSVRHSDAVAFVSTVAAKLEPNTTRQVHAITRTIFRSAVHDKLIATSPFAAIKLPPVQRGKVDPPTLADLRRVAGACGASAASALVTAAAGTGLRAGELLGLTVDRIDFLRREVTVDRQLIYIPGRPQFFGPPKTPESVRVVPIPKFVADKLAAHLAAFPAGEDGIVFQGDRGGPLARSTLHARWRSALKAAGVDIATHFHHARHAYATTLSGAGVPFTTVMELLGHAPTGVTWAIYTHRVPGWDRQVRNALETAWRDDAAADPGILADSVRTSGA